MLDELEKADLHQQVVNFEERIGLMKERAKSLLGKAKNFETDVDKLKEIMDKFNEITELFENGFYKDMIVGELEKNYIQIKDMSEKLELERQEDTTLKQKIGSLDNEEEAHIKVFDYIRNVIDDRNALINLYETNLKSHKTMIAEFNHMDLTERIIDFFQSVFIIKKKLTDRRIIHYFEWGNKNIHFYDVVNHKQTKYLVDFDNYIPKFCRTVVTDHGRLFCIAGRHLDNVCCSWMLEYIEERKCLEHRAKLNDPRSDFTAIYEGEKDRIYVIGGNDAKNFYTNCE